MIRYIYLYFLLQSANLRSRYVYKFNFYMGIFSVLLVGTSNYLLIWIITRQVPLIHGWNYNELVFMYSIFQLTHGIFIVLFNQIRRIENFVREGGFDKLFVRPLNPMFQFATLGFEIAGIGNIFSGIIGLIYAIANEFPHNFLNYCFLILTIICGTLIQAAIYTIVGTVSFWTLQSSGLRHIITPFMLQFNQFPISLYSHFIQIILTFVIPVSFISFVPTSLIYSKGDFMFNSVFLSMSPVVAIILLIISYAFWKKGLNAYKGAGS